MLNVVFPNFVVILLTLFIFYKNMFCDNIDAEICESLRIF